MTDAGSQGSAPVKNEISSWLLWRLLLKPDSVFRELADIRPEPHVVLFRYFVWLAVLPPVFAYIGAPNFGSHLGGMLMASALIGYLLAGVVSLLGLTVAT